MMLHEARWDDIYSDRKRTEKALQYNASQWRFYKGGELLTEIPNSRISYTDTSQQWHLYSFLPEGVYPHRYFIDPRRPGLASIHPEQQEFKRGHSMLYISPRFSFDTARRK